jgi:hypothetical protein
MTALFEKLPRRISHGGKRYRLRLTCASVLKALAIRTDPAVPDGDRVPWMISCLAPRAACLSLAEQGELLQRIFDEYVFRPHRRGRGGSVRAFDFNLDADLLYASFWQAYGINLRKQADRLSWWEFMALFQGLPKGTKMREVMEIRQRDMPAPTAQNQKEIRALAELKQYYALPGASGDDLAAGLEKLWVALERQAEKS